MLRIMLLHNSLVGKEMYRRVYRKKNRVFIEVHNLFINLGFHYRTDRPLRFIYFV